MGRRCGLEILAGLQAFSSQVISLGDSENAIEYMNIFKPSDFTWRLGKCDRPKRLCPVPLIKVKRK
jgi:hypothetical protein